MRSYTPDRWILLTIKSKNITVNKIFAGWYGGFANGDSWKLSSAVVTTKDCDTHFEFTNYSGSTYICHKSCMGMSMYMQSIYNQWINEANSETLDINTNELF